MSAGLLVAGVRVLSENMSSHVRLDGESLATMRANERPLAGVSTKVSPDVGDFGRLVAARSAEEDVVKWVGKVVSTPDAASWMPRSHRLVGFAHAKKKQQ